MSQGIKVPATKPDNLNLIPGIHIVERIDSSKFSSWFALAHVLICMPALTNTQHTRTHTHMYSSYTYKMQ